MAALIANLARPYWPCADPVRPRHASRARGTPHRKSFQFIVLEAGICFLGLSS